MSQKSSNGMLLSNTHTLGPASPGKFIFWGLSYGRYHCNPIVSVLGECAASINSYLSSFLQHDSPALTTPQCYNIAPEGFCVRSVSSSSAFGRDPAQRVLCAMIIAVSIFLRGSPLSLGTCVHLIHNPALPSHPTHGIIIIKSCNNLAVLLWLSLARADPQQPPTIPVYEYRSFQEMSAAQIAPFEARDPHLMDLCQGPSIPPAHLINAVEFAELKKLEVVLMRRAIAHDERRALNGVAAEADLEDRVAVAAADPPDAVDVCLHCAFMFPMRWEPLHLLLLLLQGEAFNRFLVV